MDRILDDYARSYGHEPTANWILIVHQDNTTDFYTFTDPPAMRPDLTTFVQNLSWTPALVECCRAWLAASRKRLEQRFREYCGRNGKLDWLLTAFLGLRVGRRKEFLLSPPVSDQLLGLEAGRVPAFAVLARELVRVLARSTDHSAADPGLAEMLLPLGRDYGDVRGIPVDFDSAFPFPSRGANAGELRTLPPERAHLVKQRLETALDALRQGNPVAFTFVRLLTRRLAVREEPSRPEAPASASFGELIGLALLTNPWAKRGDVAWLIDALVHESIHAALFFCEASQESLLFDRDPVPCIHSPWTGNLLPYHQYVHACFVWFGLAQLWKNWPAGAGGIPPEQIREMSRKASQGFLARPVASLLIQEVGSRVSPPVQDALRLMEQASF